MSEFSAKSVRQARKAKAAKMGAADPHTKVDSSDWTPPDALNADVKTGARPLSRRAFKSGGKVSGAKAKANMGRKPRCGGGKAGDSWVNRNVKEANAEREGKKHVGGFKKGGRTAKAGGGEMPEKPPIPPRRKDVFPNEGKSSASGANQFSKPDASKQLPGDYATNASGYADQNRKRGGRTKKMDGGPMMGGMPAMAGVVGSRVPATRFNFGSGPQGMTYKKGGKVPHSDEAADKALIKKMVKPSARTGKADGGEMDAPKPKKVPSDYNEESVDRAIASSNRAGRKISGGEAKNIKSLLGGWRERVNKYGRKDGGAADREGRATGGRTKGKGKTNINIVIATGKGQPQDGAPGMPPGMPPGGPMSLQRPMGGPPGGMPMMPPGAPAGGPPGMAPPPPMARKSGGRITKVAKSYKDMEAGAGSAEGRLQKTDIAKRLPKPREDGENVYDGKGYPNKPTGMTGGRLAKKAGGKVYRSYKDMDAGAGSGEGRLEKAEIQKRKN